jgi:hypothetical protein
MSVSREDISADGDIGARHLPVHCDTLERGGPFALVTGARACAECLSLVLLTAAVRWDGAALRFRCLWCVSCVCFARRRDDLRASLPADDASQLAAYEVFAEAALLSDTQLFALLVSLVDSNTVDLPGDGVGEEYSLRGASSGRNQAGTALHPVGLCTRSRSLQY